MYTRTSFQLYSPEGQEWSDLLWLWIHSGRAQGNVKSSVRYRSIEGWSRSQSGLGSTTPGLPPDLNVEAKTKVDAVTLAHGQPITFLTVDWASLIIQFKMHYGMSIHDAKLPAQSYYESFEERSHHGIIEAENLARVVSHAEEREQIASNRNRLPRWACISTRRCRSRQKKRYLLTYTKSL